MTFCFYFQVWWWNHAAEWFSSDWKIRSWSGWNVSWREGRSGVFNGEHRQLTMMMTSCGSCSWQRSVFQFELWRKNLSWWRHQMETFFALLAIYAGNSPLTGEFPTQRPVTRIFDFFICARINGWVNNREACDLGRHHAYDDVLVMKWVLDNLSVTGIPVKWLVLKLRRVMDVETNYRRISNNGNDTNHITVHLCGKATYPATLKYKDLC